ncbi:MAG: hypothetical protein K2O28_05305 [Clostridia bacterium]|nr:hypothetical protein [Clostridia bacterium]
MAQLIEESLLQAIKKDDIKAFDALMEKAQCGTYRLGRFPVLSLMYLYNSRQMLAAYEEKFIKIPNYEELREPVEVSKKFSEKAGKCLRLYLNEVVTPLEMLLILDKTRRLTRIYPLTKPSSAVKARLKSIYSVRYSLDVNFEGDKIVIARKPLSLRAKRNIAIICACSVFAVGIVVGVPVTVNAFKVDFSSRSEYTLKRDLVLTESVKEVNCKIIGNGHKIILKKGASLGECNGTVSDLTIESYGNAVFTTVSVSAVIEKVTVNVSAEVEATEGTALVAVTNYGTIDGVTVNISGRVNALAPSGEGAVDFACGGLVQTNAFKTQDVYGIIKNCTVNYSQFSLSGEQSADASFGGVAGVNNGYLQDCTVSGEIKADTFDIAGVCSVNNGVLSATVNEANLSQTSANTGWNPLASGIVLTNNGTVEYCENTGSVSAKSTCVLPEGATQVPTVTVAGIAGVNAGTVGACVNGGSVTAEGKGGAYVGGIAAQSYSLITTCISNGDIAVLADKVYAGGILGFGLINYYGYWGTVDYCICESKISATANGDEGYFVGGITGLAQQGKFTNSIDSSVVYAGGGVTKSYFLGECVAYVKYFGNIAGVCGEFVYQNNTISRIFDGNYYLDNNSSAFGAIVKEDDSFVSVEDDGADVATIEEMQNTEAYQAILKALNKSAL